MNLPRSWAFTTYCPDFVKKWRFFILNWMMVAGNEAIDEQHDSKSTFLQVPYPTAFIDKQPKKDEIRYKQTLSEHADKPIAPGSLVGAIITCMEVGDSYSCMHARVLDAVPSHIVKCFQMEILWHICETYACTFSSTWIGKTIVQLYCHKLC